MMDEKFTLASLSTKNTKIKANQILPKNQTKLGPLFRFHYVAFFVDSGLLSADTRQI